MEIEFVNHSCFIINYKGVRVICDPWLEGSVFNNGWRLICETKFKYEDFASINYIWFSHEHPDHFYPPNLVKIPVEYRKNITVLFQYTKDKRVVDYCKSINFKEVIELMPNQWYKIHEDLKVLCEPYEEGDSWICFKTNDLCYLNTNDCGIMTHKAAQKRIACKVGKVDVLLSQFSYAYGIGNPEDVRLRQQKAQEKLELFKIQCEVFKPKVVIPIASYIYFSHTENHWLNDSINTPRKTYNFFKENTDAEPVVLYCGQKYTFGQAHDSMQSIALYEADYEKVSQITLDKYTTTQTVPEKELQSAASVFIEDMNRNNSWLLKMILKPTYIFVKDYNKTYSLSLKGFTEVKIDAEKCDVSLTSENLLFCFKYPYGIDTTQINGRMQKPRQGNYKRFYNLFRVNQLKSRGIDPNSMFYLLGVLRRRLFPNY
ncbi:MAG: MBL fold metallo-hydrolase [Bacteroidia bacterium]|nr:MBL fold metallo-hydrolase [Bacteroidia bacterium]MDW8347817.1 MBL fold metallo-hydrolase [Bacteroidia bacterium]